MVSWIRKVFFIDGTHIKASANPHKYQNETMEKEARCYEKELQEEIEKDRLEHGKKPLKEKRVHARDHKQKGQHYRSRQWLVPQRGTQAGVCLCSQYLL